MAEQNTSDSHIIRTLLTTLLQTKLVASITATCLLFPRVHWASLCSSTQEAKAANLLPEDLKVQRLAPQQRADRMCSMSQREPAALEFSDKAKMALQPHSGTLVQMSSAGSETERRES